MEFTVVPFASSTNISGTRSIFFTYIRLLTTCSSPTVKLLIRTLFFSSFWFLHWSAANRLPLLMARDDITVLPTLILFFFYRQCSAFLFLCLNLSSSLFTVFMTDNFPQSAPSYHYNNISFLFHFLAHWTYWMSPFSRKTEPNTLHPLTLDSWTYQPSWSTIYYLWWEYWWHNSMLRRLSSFYSEK